MERLEPLRFHVGRGDWFREIRVFTDQFDHHYWDDFRPCGEADIAACERAINRALPGDFREFLLRVGAGNFGCGGGDVYTPEEIVLACHGPLLTLLGSADWATDDEQRQLYSSRRAHNPRPELFTAEALIFDGVSLLDLLQIGSDGQGCYHQLHLPDRPRLFGYCLLDCGGESLDVRLPSFTDGLKRILTQSWRSARGVDQPGSFGLDISGIVFDD